MKNCECKVSVIVPVYNSEKYVKDCIESIKNQDYTDLEIILVDDGSTDNSGEIIDLYQEKDKRIKVIHQVNQGVSVARNNGLDVATGKFVTFVDADDWLAADYISYLLYLQDMQDADLCYTTKVFMKRNDCQDAIIKEKSISALDSTLFLLSPSHIVGCWNKLYRREWLIEHGFKQNESLFSGEGLHFSVTVSQLANVVTISNKRIYYYRKDVEESATTKFNLNMITNNEISLEIIKQDLVIKDKRIYDMIDFFHENLMLTGIFAILNYSKKSAYYNQYSKWRKQIFSLGMKIVFKSNTDTKYKLKVICVNISPRICANISKIRRKKLFDASV